MVVVDDILWLDSVVGLCDGLREQLEMYCVSGMKSWVKMFS